MGLATGPNAILQPSASQLIGKPDVVVEPNAVSAMVSAFRSGQVSAQDIIDRVSERAKLKEKADVMALKESMSPEAQQGRAFALQAASSRAKALAENAALQQKADQSKLQQEIAKGMLGQNGPMIEAGYAAVGRMIPTKTDPELPGALVPDLDQIKQDMPDITAYLSEAQRTAADAKNWKMEKFVSTGPKGEAVVSMRPFNAVTGLFADRMPDGRMPSFDLWRQKRGQVQTAPQVAPQAAAQAAPLVEPRIPTMPVTVNDNVPQMRAQLSERLGETGPTQVSQMSDGQVKAALFSQPAGKPVVQPTAAAAPKAEITVGQFIPGQGLVTEVTAPKEEDKRSKIQFISSKYEANPTVKGLAAANEAFQATRDVLDQIKPDGTYGPKPPFLPKQGDYKMMVAYAKILDPNSVVREGEIKLLEGTKSAWQNLANAVNDRTFSEYVNTLLGKQMFNPQERNSFRNLLTASYTNRVEAVRPIFEASKAAMEAYDATPEEIGAMLPFHPVAAGTATPAGGKQPPPGFIPNPTMPGTYVNPKTLQGWRP